MRIHCFKYRRISYIKLVKTHILENMPILRSLLQSYTLTFESITVVLKLVRIRWSTQTEIYASSTKSESHNICEQRTWNFLLNTNVFAQQPKFICKIEITSPEIRQFLWSLHACCGECPKDPNIREYIHILFAILKNLMKYCIIIHIICPWFTSFAVFFPSNINFFSQTSFSSVFRGQLHPQLGICGTTWHAAGTKQYICTAREHWSSVS